MKALIKNGSGVHVEKTGNPGLTGPKDVLVRIALTGLCRTDIYVADGLIPSKNPLILGHEFSGVVEKVGSEVERVDQGMRVTAMPLLPRGDIRLPNGLPSYSGAKMLGVDDDGAFGEFVVVPEHAVYKLPDGVSLMHGAYMEPVAASLAVLNVGLDKSKKGLIFGDNRISRLTQRIMLAAGFSDVDICEADEDLADDTYDFIVETLVNTKTIAKMVRAIKPGGRIVLKSRQHVPVSIVVNQLVMKDVSLESVSYGDFQAGIDLVASGKLHVADLFGDVFGLDRFEGVFAAARKGESRKLFLSAADRDVWER
jgi:L-iditol 2-dehydrogenase